MSLRLWNPRRLIALMGLVIVLASLPYCSKKPAPIDEGPSKLDRIDSSAVPPPKRFLHKTFSMKEYQAYAIEVPARIVRARVEGSFQSSIVSSGSEPISDESTAVELMLMNAEQFDDFTHRRGATSTYAVEPSFSQQVEIDLPPTQDDPVKYFLVFRNAPGGAPRSVQADFSLTFR